MTTRFRTTDIAYYVIFGDDCAVWFTAYIFLFFVKNNYDNNCKVSFNM